MSKNLIIGVVASVIILGGIIWFANPTKQNQASMTANSKGIFKAQESNFDFGSISMAKGKVTHTFTFTNTGTEPILLGKMYTSCMCTQAKLMLNGNAYGPYGMEGMGFIPKLNKTVNPGETASIDAIFDPAAHGPAGVGKIERVVTLENNAGDPLQFQISAEVTP